METSSTETSSCDITRSRFDYVKSLKYFECGVFFIPAWRRKKKKKTVQAAVSLRQRQFHGAFLSFLLKILKKHDHVEDAFISCLTDADTRQHELQLCRSFLALVWSAPVKLLDSSACETRSCAEICFEMKANTSRSAWSSDKVWGLLGALFIM